MAPKTSKPTTRYQVTARTSPKAADRILKKLEMMPSKKVRSGEVERLIAKEMVKEMSYVIPQLPIVRILSAKIVRLR